MSFYNGYSPKQRAANLRAYHGHVRRGEYSAVSHVHRGGPCDLCGDPQAEQWHSEDYSEPFRFEPPASYKICRVCHLSWLHQRFRKPVGWHAFLMHVREGGFGRNFSKRSPRERTEWEARIRRGEVDLGGSSGRTEAQQARWWERLSTDPITLIAAWARPRPLREYPSESDYRAALARISPSDRELALLRAHAQAPHRSASMRTLAIAALGSTSHASANNTYGALAHRISESVGFAVDRRPEDQSPVWTSAVAEGWQPTSGDYEWVMVSTLAASVLASGGAP